MTVSNAGPAVGHHRFPDRLAFALSAVFSPFAVLAAFLALLAYQTSPDRRTALIWSALAIGGMVAVPALFVLHGVWQGRISDVHVQIREQRPTLFIAAIAGCAFAAALLWRVGASPQMVLAAVAAVANGLLFLAVTLRWKIAMHPATLTASALMAGHLIGPQWFWGLAAVPPLIWARVHRGRHTWAQGMAAVALAGSLMEILVWLYQRAPRGLA